MNSEGSLACLLLAGFVGLPLGDLVGPLRLTLGLELGEALSAANDLLGPAAHDDDDHYDHDDDDDHDGHVGRGVLPQGVGDVDLVASVGEDLLVLDIEDLVVDHLGAVASVSEPGPYGSLLGGLQFDLGPVLLLAGFGVEDDDLDGDVVGHVAPEVDGEVPVLHVGESAPGGVLGRNDLHGRFGCIRGIGLEDECE